MQKNDFRKINDPKERLRIVLTSLPACAEHADRQPGVNKSAVGNDSSAPHSVVHRTIEHIDKYGKCP